MDRFLKRKLDEPARRPDPATETAEAQERVTPSTVLSWNANGLMARIEASREVREFGQLVARLSPDVVCIQEARIRAYCATPRAPATSSHRRVRGRPADDENEKLQRLLRDPAFSSTRPARPSQPPGP